MIKNKLKTFSIVMFVLILLIVSGCSEEIELEEGKSASSGNNGEYELRIAHPIPEDHSLHQALVSFKEEVEQNSDGRIEVSIFPDGQLFSSERESVEAAQLNNVEMTVVITGTMEGFIPEFSVLSLPFLFDTKEQAHEAIDGEIGEKLVGLLPEADLVGMGFGELGFRHVFNNVGPIVEPSDLKGFKFRVLESKMHETTFNTLGANSSPLGFGEVYMSLQQGVFDGMDSEITIANSTQLYDVTDYLSLTGHLYTAFINVMSKDFYDSLPEDLQQVLDDAAANYTVKQRELNTEDESESLKRLEESMEVNELSPEEKEVFREKLQPIYEDYADTIGEDLMDLLPQ